jgi:tRNA-splicing ligase RtcB
MVQRIIGTENKPIKLWLNDCEESALDQARNIANLPFVFKHVALMPDAHLGMGCPIGSVVATRDVVVINLVGVDISCGVGFFETDIPVDSVDKDTLKKIMGAIRQRIPMGLNGNHKEPINVGLMPELINMCPVVSSQWIKAAKALSTLGSCNHFGELQRNTKGNLCVMVHSGSRNLGKQVADYYDKKAQELNEKYFSKVPKEWKLAFLPMDSEEAHLYLNEMEYCMRFARTNRSLMLAEIELAISDYIGNLRITDRHDVHHNYARMEHHFGKNVLVHRKGATSASEGEIGLIPGSQGTKSYVVKGKGNPESFKSCSHGSGRAMSRSKARKELNLQKEIDLLDSRGIIHGLRSVNGLDEAPSSYKNIETVMAYQSDLVEIIDELTPIANIKGN